MGSRLVCTVAIYRELRWARPYVSGFVWNSLCIGFLVQFVVRVQSTYDISVLNIDTVQTQLGWVPKGRIIHSLTLISVSQALDGCNKSVNTMNAHEHQYSTVCSDISRVKDSFGLKVLDTLSSENCHHFCHAF